MGRIAFFKNSVCKYNSNNIDLMSYLKFISESKLDIYPNFISLNKDFYSYKKIRGFVYKKCKMMKIYQIKNIFKVIRLLHDDSVRFSCNGNEIIFCHNDLSQFNMVFNFFGRVKKVIDYDECGYNYKNYDLIHLLFTTINIGNWRNENIVKIIKRIVIGLRVYGLTNNEIKKLIKKDIYEFIKYKKQYFIDNSSNFNLSDKMKWLVDILHFFKHYEEEIVKYLLFTDRDLSL